MEKVDPELEAQVWDRVMGAPETRREDPGTLLLSAWEQASVFRYLTGLLSGKDRERMHSLQARSGETVAALRGLQRLSGGRTGTLPPIPIPREPVRRLLEKSYFRALGLMTEFTARGLDPEFGVVYQALADRERGSALLLTQLLGGLKT